MRFFVGGTHYSVRPKPRDPRVPAALRVLIVDDEANTREVFTEILRSYGPEIKTAGSVQEAFTIFQHFKPHVLVSDISMPGEDGYSLIRRIRALKAEQGGNVPALAVTAYAGVADIQKAVSAGFQAHLAKPVDGYHLAEAIAKLVHHQT